MYTIVDIDNAFFLQKLSWILFKFVLKNDFFYAVRLLFYYIFYGELFFKDKLVFYLDQFNLDLLVNNKILCYLKLLDSKIILRSNYPAKFIEKIMNHFDIFDAVIIGYKKLLNNKDFFEIVEKMSKKTSIMYISSQKISKNNFKLFFELGLINPSHSYLKEIKISNIKYMVFYV